MIPQVNFVLYLLPRPIGLPLRLKRLQSSLAGLIGIADNPSSLLLAVVGPGSLVDSRHCLRVLNSRDEGSPRPFPNEALPCGPAMMPEPPSALAIPQRRRSTEARRQG